MIVGNLQRLRSAPNDRTPMSCVFINGFHMKMSDEGRAIPVFGLPEIVSGANIVRLIYDQCLINNTLPCDGDLNVVAQKIISKSNECTPCP